MSKPPTNGGKPNNVQKGKKIFDIARPGNTLASVNSRPVLASAAPAFKDGINDISAPPPSAKAERAFTRASNPSDTHKRLIGAKSRVVIQPAGMLSQDPEARSEPSAPQSQSSSNLVDFDLSSLPGYEQEHKLREDLYSPDNASKPTVSEAQTDKEEPAAPLKEAAKKPEAPKKPAAKQPAWITTAEKDIQTPSDSPVSPLPEGLIVAEHTPVGTNWAWVTIIIVAAVAAVLVLVCSVMIIIQVSKG